MKKTDFDIHFGNAFATMNQSKFEGWFAAMACRVFGTDFELIKAGGQDGDKKSDGRRISTETVYQCYAPESPATFAAKAKAKIANSFPEVVNYWPNIKEWVLFITTLMAYRQLQATNWKNLESSIPHSKW